MNPPITYRQWLDLTPQQREWELATWNPYCRENIHIAEEALARHRAASPLPIVGGCVGTFHMGEYILNPALMPEHIDQAPPFLTTEFEGFRVGFVEYCAQLDEPTDDAPPPPPWWVYRVFDSIFGLTRAKPEPVRVHLIYCDNHMVLSKRRYAEWRHIQDNYADYKASLGPWTEEDLVEFFAIDFGPEPAWPFSRSQIAAFIESTDETLST